MPPGNAAIVPASFAMEVERSGRCDVYRQIKRLRQKLPSLE